MANLLYTKPVSHPLFRVSWLICGTLVPTQLAHACVPDHGSFSLPIFFVAPIAILLVSLIITTALWLIGRFIFTETLRTQFSTILSFVLSVWLSLIGSLVISQLLWLSFGLPLGLLLLLTVVKEKNEAKRSRYVTLAALVEASILFCLVFWAFYSKIFIMGCM